jgi:hypothetical protein
MEEAPSSSCEASEDGGLFVGGHLVCIGSWTRPPPVVEGPPPN